MSDAHQNLRTSNGHPPFWETSAHCRIMPATLQDKQVKSMPQQHSPHLLACWIQVRFYPENANKRIMSNFSPTSLQCPRAVLVPSAALNFQQCVVDFLRDIDKLWQVELSTTILVVLVALSCIRGSFALCWNKQDAVEVFKFVAQKKAENFQYDLPFCQWYNEASCCTPEQAQLLEFTSYRTNCSSTSTCCEEVSEKCQDQVRKNLILNFLKHKLTTGCSVEFVVLQGVLAWIHWLGVWRRSVSLQKVCR